MHRRQRRLCHLPDGSRSRLLSGLRSQTIIVGAIAIAICLIAASFVFSSVHSGGEAKRVIRTQRGSVPANPTAEEQTGQRGIIRSCGEEVGVGPETTCDLGMQVWREEQRSGSASAVSVEDPASGEEISLGCEGGGASASIVCAGDGATVYLAGP
jgi:hypothetical protein